jgi:hypothetical protein
VQRLFVREQQEVPIRVLVRVVPAVFVLVLLGIYLQPKLSADCPVCACAADQPVCDEDGNCVCPDVSCECGTPYCDPTYGSTCNSEPSCDCGAYCDDNGNWQCNEDCGGQGGGCTDCSCDPSCQCDECDSSCYFLKYDTPQPVISDCCYDMGGCYVD